MLKTFKTFYHLRRAEPKFLLNIIKGVILPSHLNDSLHKDEHVYDCDDDDVDDDDKDNDELWLTFVMCFVSPAYFLCFF